MVTLHLKNGDRLTGDLVEESAEQIIIRTPWNPALSIPPSEVTSREEVAAPAVPSPEAPKAEPAEESAPTSPEPAPVVIPVVVPEPEKPPAAAPAEASGAKANAPAEVVPAPKASDKWKWDFRAGADFLNGAKDRRIYTGHAAVTYTRKYDKAPREFLRNRLEYNVDYGETDGQVSANRMRAANKLDLDVGSDFYAYVAMAAGYDYVRKIEYDYDGGPGAGYHLLSKKTLALDTELGLNYQYREGVGTAPDREMFQGRVGQQLTWELMPKITLTEKLTFLPLFHEMGEYQLRLEGNIGFGIVQHVSLNFTVRNLYDSQPAPGVPNNEFQFRSTLGVTF